MGPIIRGEARDAVLAFQRDAEAAGGEVLVRSEAMDDPSGARGSDAGYYITPGVLRVPRFGLLADARRDSGCDVEVFGPLLRVASARDFDDAMEQANATRFGLAASIFTRDAALAERFVREARAGCVNVNTGTAGASSRLPFGGLGHSGNHRPAGSFSLDYCVFPVASMVEESDAATMPPGMRFEESWLR
jgi:succinylglutamic semialdehyde dehydrogenase